MGKKDSDFHEFISQMVDIQFLWRQGLLKQEKERSALNQHSLNSFVLLPADNTHTQPRIYICTYADTHSFVLLPVDRRWSVILSCRELNSEAICRVRMVWSDSWGPDFQNRLMIVTFISAIRQLVPADYLPLNTAITAAPHVKIIRIRCWNIHLACDARRY